MSQLAMERRSCPICWGEEMRFERLLTGYRLERCKNCGLVFVNPQYTKESIEKIYEVKEDPEKFVSLYARIHTPSVLAEYDKVLDIIEAQMPGRGKLLDFACAAGYFYERALGRGWDAHGVDLGDWCKLAADKRGLPNMNIGHLKAMNFPDEHFDVVVAAEVLEHLPHPKEDLAEVRRILRPGGMFYVTVPNYQCLAIVLGRNKFSLNTPPQHINYFTPKTLVTLLDHTGFDVDRTFSVGGVNWENIIGKEVDSEILDAYAPEAMAAGEAPNSFPVETTEESRENPLKQFVYPVYQKVANEWGKVGLMLAAVAWRPPGAFPP